MTEFRPKRVPGIASRAEHAASKTGVLSGAEKRRGVRVNSRVPVAVQWDAAGQSRRDETQTRVVGPYGCLVVLPESLKVHSPIQVTNLVSKQSNAAIVVWCGNQRSEGWELGIELINPQMDFWGLEL